MHVVKFNRILPSFSIKYRKLNTAVVNDEYTDAPQYPPILDASQKSKQIRKIEDWSNVIQSLQTVEEKQMKLNSPRYYGWKTIILNDTQIPYNAMNLTQHCTRTHFKEIQQLPTFYDSINVDVIAADLKPLIEEALTFEYLSYKRKHELYNSELDEAVKENIISDSIVQQINRILLNNLSTLPHLLNTQVDYNPRHEAFWFVGGIYPPTKVKKFRESIRTLKDTAEDPVDRSFQYMGKPSIAVRTELPLEPIISHEESTSQDFNVPFFDYDPKVLGFNTTHKHGTNIPGFWPGDSCEFGLISYQKRGHILERMKSYGEQDNQEALHSQGIMSSFAWLLSQASYQGFTTYNDVTYPLVAQTVITNGKEWSFYVYQLNTTLMHSDFINNNPKRNICWGTPILKLFDHVDENGKLIGFNEQVIKMLLKFYTNLPKQRDGIEMKPYLSKSAPFAAKIEDDEKSEWLEKQYKYMMSNRPRHRLPYEIYHWEKIYKIDHKTRPMEARRRPFELAENPWKRKVEDTSAPYLPKALRPGGPKSKPKYYKTFYP